MGKSNKKKNNKKNEKNVKVIFGVSLALVVVISITLVFLFGNSSAIDKDKNGVYKLSFKETTSNTVLNSLDDKTVSITGYLSTLSPLNGKFAYLMNMPYQSCPFCVPGTSELTNTLAIYAKENEKIEFTDSLVTVIGTLEVGEFTDEFGYNYGIRLKDVLVNKADSDALEESVKKYNVLAENGIVSEIYNCIMMADNSVYYDYYEYDVPSIIDVSLITNTKNELGNYNEDGDYNSLVLVLNDLIYLSDEANGYIESGNYTELKNLQEELNNIYYSFSDWLSEGEM